MITAKIIADSVAKNGKRITTFELEYPRFIHSEFMTHRMVSKNAASSRAIPVAATIKTIEDNPAMPVFWGKNQAGMAAKEELDDSNREMRVWGEVTQWNQEDDSLTAQYSANRSDLEHAKTIWLAARSSAIAYAQELIKIGLHKQVANRILEPWVHMKVVATATDWDNFFHLRRHPDAQPEIHALANVMWDVYSTNEPELLYLGEYHLPYVTNTDMQEWGEENCIKLSASLCAQVSYRKADESMEKAMAIFERLVKSTPVHASPFEHQATPSMFSSEKSGNFNGWLQFRQSLENNVCHFYTP